MNHALYSFRWVLLSALAVLLVVPQVQAQEDDTRDRREVVIMFEDADPIVIVDGDVLSDEDAEAYLKEHDLEDGFRKNVVWSGPFGDRMTIYRLGGDGPVTFFGHPRGAEDFAIRMRDGLHGEALQDYLEGVENLADREWNVRVFDDNLLQGRAFFRGDLPGSMEKRSEIARMDRESRRLAQQVRRAEGAERERLEQELQDKLSEIFDQKQALRQQEIDRLRERLDDLEADRSERAQARQEVIERRIRQLLGESDVYDW